MGIKDIAKKMAQSKAAGGGNYLRDGRGVLIVKALTFEMLSKRFHYPDGETRPWTVSELRSGDKFPAGFDFDEEIRQNFDFATRSMLAAAV